MFRNDCAFVPVSEYPVELSAVVLAGGVAERVVNAPVFGVVDPMADGLARFVGAEINPPINYPSKMLKLDPALDESHQTAPVLTKESMIIPPPAANCMPCVVVGVNPIPMVTVTDGSRFWHSKYFLELFVTAVVSCAVLAVVTDPKRVVRAPEGKAETVTVVLETVTVPLMGCVACQNVPLTGTVPLMLAVTEPI